MNKNKKFAGIVQRVVVVENEFFQIAVILDVIVFEILAKLKKKK